MSRNESLTRQRVEAYELGMCGLSLRGLALRGIEPGEAHVELVARGFRCTRYAIAAVRTRAAAPRWRTRAGVTATPGDAEIAHELLYVHGDGGAVRVYPTRGPSPAYDEITRGPFARKSVLMPTATRRSFRDEACVVTDAGVALPRCLRMAAGLKFDPRDLVASHRLAEVAFGEQVIPLKEGAPPAVPLTEGYGLPSGFTVTFGGDFFAIAGEMREAARRQRAMVLESEKAGDVQLFFSGGNDVGRRLRPRSLWPGLASLSLHLGTGVLGIDPFGYEASVDQLVSFLVEQLQDLAEIRVLENATGRDVTKDALRLPHELFGPDAPA